MIKTYLIFFTPRSGSSWLTDLCARTHRLGRPGEVFNPDLRKGLDPDGEPLADRVARIVQRNVRGGVFGAEVTMYHLRSTFGDPETLFAHFGDAATMLLIREDTVLQSISILRKKQTQVGHSVSKRKIDDEAFQYDPNVIKRTVQQRTKTERTLLAMLKEQGRVPLLLSYERNMANPLGAINAMAAHIGVPPVPKLKESNLTILRTSKSEEFAQQFKQENPVFMKKIERLRSELIENLAQY